MMNNLLDRLRKSGLNIMVLVVSIVIFVVTFMALNGLAQAQKPPTVQVLAAAHSLDIGAIIQPADMIEKTVYEDENTALFIPVDQAGDVVGGIVALPVSAGHPFFKSAILAPVSEGTRFSAVLNQYPDYSLFPLPLEAMNVLAPDIELFLPGDLVGLTVVIADRPQVVETKAAPEQLFEITPTLSEEDLQATLTAYESQKNKTPQEESLERTYPPLAKDLFPAGVRVIAVQGAAPDVSSGDGDSAVQTSLVDPTRTQMLILLVPNQSREELALSMQQGDQLIVSLLARGEDITTPGFTYWDFEDEFKSDRAEALGLPSDDTVTPTPTPLVVTPTPEITPASELSPTATSTP